MKKTTLNKKLISAACLAVAAAACSASPEGEKVGASTAQAITAGDIYNFGTLANPGSCLDALAGGTADGTQIQEYWCNGTGAQAYEVVDAGGGMYNLVNPQSNKCIDVNARGTADGTKIQLWDCNGTPAQTFYLEPQSNGYVTIVNTNANKCLDVQGDNPANGTVVQLYDCNGTNAQLWNPAIIGQSSSSGGSSSGGGSSGGGSSSGGNNGGAFFVDVTNDCPVNLWIHGVGQEGVLSPDNVELAPGQSQQYTSPPLTWTAARIYAYLGGPEQGDNDKVEMNFSTSGGVETINTDVTYVDWVALPSQIQAIGSGSDCTTVGCEVPYSQILSGCPSSLLSGQECLSAGNYCLNPNNNGDPFCHALDGQISACASEYGACAGASGSTTAEVYSCSGSFFSQQPEWCAALNRGVLSNPAGAPASSYYTNPPYNQYSAWVHDHCPGIYAFPYDDYGSSNQSSDHTCAGATELHVTFCPKG